jgi:hypothetical protein
MTIRSARVARQREVSEAGRGVIVRFPDARSFGPLSWSTVRLASAIVLILLLGGALLGIIFRRPAGALQGSPASAPAVPS